MEKKDKPVKNLKWTKIDKSKQIAESPFGTYEISVNGSTIAGRRNLAEGIWFGFHKYSSSLGFLTITDAKEQAEANFLERQARYAGSANPLRDELATRLATLEAKEGNRHRIEVYKEAIAALDASKA